MSSTEQAAAEVLLGEATTLNEKFNARQAETTLNGIVKLFAQVKFVEGSKNKDIIKRWDDMYYTTSRSWFSTDELLKMGLPKELK